MGGASGVYVLFLGTVSYSTCTAARRCSETSPLGSSPVLEVEQAWGRKVRPGGFVTMRLCYRGSVVLGVARYGFKKKKKTLGGLITHCVVLTTLSLVGEVQGCFRKSSVGTMICSMDVNSTVYSGQPSRTEESKHALVTIKRRV